MTERSAAAQSQASGAQSSDISISAPFWLLASVTLGGSLSMHIFVPAQTMVESYMRATHMAVQATLSIYVFGLGVGQLCYGPISDSVGRKPVLLFGMGLYTVGSLAALSSRSVEMLLAARLAQGLGGGAGVVLGRAIVRDSFGERRSVEMLALLNLAVLLAPGISPVLGSALSAIGGWRLIFVVLALFGAANLVSTLAFVREVTRRSKRQKAPALTTYRELLGDRAFAGYALAGGCASTSIYAFIGSAPFIFVHELHRRAGEIGIYLMLNIVGIGIGSMMSRFLVRRVKLSSIMTVGNAVSGLGAAMLVAFSVSGELSLASILTSMLLFTIGAGAVSPLSMAQALNVKPTAAGSSSGLYGCTQMLVGALCSSLAGFGRSPALTSSLIMLSGTMVIAFSLRLATSAPVVREKRS